MMRRIIFPFFVCRGGGRHGSTVGFSRNRDSVAVVSNSSYVDRYHDPSYDHRSLSLFFSENTKMFSFFMSPE